MDIRSLASATAFHDIVAPLVERFQQDLPEPLVRDLFIVWYDEDLVQDWRALSQQLEAAINRGDVILPIVVGEVHEPWHFRAMEAVKIPSVTESALEKLVARMVKSLPGTAQRLAAKYPKGGSR